MQSLSAHLRESDDHGRLPFNPFCPVCREERLTGALVSEPVISRRARAALAASVLALSTAAPAAAIAGEPDQEQDGTAPPAQPGSGDPAQSPGFDPGGDSTDLPFDAAPAPELQAPPDPGSDDSAPLDQEPATDPGAPVADPGDGSVAPDDQQAPPVPGTPPTQAPTPISPAPSTPAPPPAPATPITPPDASTVPQVVSGKPQATVNRKARRRHVAHTPHESSESVTRPGPTPAPTETTAPAVQVAQAEPAARPAIADGKRAKPGDRSHQVLAGESLWSIARDMLGGEASPARIARAVHRLWTLNRERIGTGDPDLLMVGTTLILR